MNLMQILKPLRRGTGELSAIFLFAVVMSVWGRSTAFAAIDPTKDAGRLFELHAKLPPGMTISAMNELLGDPAEEHTVGGSSGVIRYMWMHGEMGIEAYFTKEAAYRIAITLPCQNEKNVLRMMDALTRQGNSKYGSMPQFDHTKGEYYWVRDNVRFAFSKYNSTTVSSSMTRAQ